MYFWILDWDDLSGSIPTLLLLRRVFPSPGLPCHHSAGPTWSCTHSLQAQNCQLLLHEEATYIYRKPSKCQPVSLQTFPRAWVWLGGTVGACGDSLAAAFEVLKEKSVKVILGYVALTWDELKEDKKAYFWPRTSLYCLYSWLLLSYRSHFGIRVSA